jgi:hypothetical protein
VEPLSPASTGPSGLTSGKAPSTGLSRPDAHDGGHPGADDRRRAYGGDDADCPRLVGILHGCLRHHTRYDEVIAWHTELDEAAA